MQIRQRSSRHGRGFFHAGLWIVIALGVAGCSSQPAGPPPPGAETYLGASREELHKEFGEPDRSSVLSDGFLSESFFKAGLSVSFDDMGKAISVEGSQYVSGDSFPGKILGIGLNDSRKACHRQWGEPVSTEKKSAILSYEKVTWHYQDYELRLEMWTKDADPDDDDDWPHKKDTVKKIRVTRRAN